MGTLSDRLSGLGLGSNTTIPSGVEASVVGLGSAPSDLPTSAITLFSHAHGRERREERGIAKRQLQEAVKYGRKEPANPGRDGRPRWRYTHKGIVYITDETSRHEITSWRAADALEPPPPPPGDFGGGDTTSHVVMIVDSSGSMRTGDVPGYATRTAAVYDCLARDLVEPQIRLGSFGDVEVSLIEISDDVAVVLERFPGNESLLKILNSSTTRRARSHGNYLPALDAVSELLSKDVGRSSHVFLVFLSDGAPSDHKDMLCEHGYGVWQPDPYDTILRHGTPRLQRCPFSAGNQCRKALQKFVKDECVRRIKLIGDLLGRDRVHVHTVAFGPPKANYQVLEAMADALPRGSFQKLGLSADCLRTAFTSLTSTLTALRMRAFGTGPGDAAHGLTLRTDISKNAERQVYRERSVIRNGEGWDIYVGNRCSSKRKYNHDKRCYVDVPFTEFALVEELQRQHPGQVERGIAHAAVVFAEGAERAVFQCTEVVSVDGGATAYSIGPRLVAKETRHTEHLGSRKFHRSFCRTQNHAEELAELFNRRVKGRAEWQIRFLPCYVLTLLDDRYPAGECEILVEEELEGVFTKWNDNAGGVAKGNGDAAAQQTRALDGITEGVEEEEEERKEKDDEGTDEEAVEQEVPVEDVPQCFSHFTYAATHGRSLVCDLQGVWNPVDGFTLTDPVIHTRAGTNRATDKGQTGIGDFFATHRCGLLCQRLKLGVPKRSRKKRWWD